MENKTTDNNAIAAKRVIIIGAGIAGLSLAIQLTEQKVPCIVLEGRTDFSGPTSGVRISADGVRILEKIGVINVGSDTERLIMHFGNRKVDFLVENKIGRSPAIIVTRQAIFQKLLDRINFLGIEVIYGFKLAQARENDQSVAAVSTEGQRIEGSYLVGADGVGSVVRKILNPGKDSEKAYAGYLGIGLIFPNGAKEEMSLFNHVNGSVGLASIGKVNAEDDSTNLFLWTHMHMPESDAKVITDKMVMKELSVRSQSWNPYLRNLFKELENNPKTIISQGPVYNGELPSTWYSKRLFIIGDAAHPYGPGGQGISMALKDAEALSKLLSALPSGEEKSDFQNTRAQEARNLGESSEKRNKPENQISSNYGLFYNWIFMKAVHFFNGGKIKL